MDVINLREGILGSNDLGNDHCCMTCHLNTHADQMTLCSTQRQGFTSAHASRIERLPAGAGELRHVMGTLRNMTEYIRPTIVPVEFRDDDGQIINYGNRWPDSPPDDQYSETRHPDRFAPLHIVANALIDHLNATYDVLVEEGSHLVADLDHPVIYHAVTRAVKLSPKVPGTAEILIALTDQPGITLGAGALFSEQFPDCGCDACDESVERCMNELEQRIFAIIGGGLKENTSVGCPDDFMPFDFLDKNFPELAPGTWVEITSFATESSDQETFEPGVIAENAKLHSGSAATHNADEPVYSFQLTRPAPDGSAVGGSVLASDLPRTVLDRAQAMLSALNALSAEGDWLPWPLRETSDQ